MDRLDRRFDLKPAHRLFRRRPTQQRLSLHRHRLIPQRHILLIQRNQHAIRQTRIAARINEQQQGAQAQRLSLIR